MTSIKVPLLKIYIAHFIINKLLSFYVIIYNTILMQKGGVAMNISVNSGIFKDFSAQSKAFLISSSTNNYLKPNNTLPTVLSLKNTDELSISKKESEKLQKEIDGFQNLIKNINSSVGFSEVAKSAIAKQNDLLNLIKEKSKDVDSAKAIGDLIFQMDYVAKNTIYNDKNLLTGEFKNQKFLNGMNSNDFVDISLNSTKSQDLGQLRYETTKSISEGGSISITLQNKNKSLEFSNVAIGYNQNQGVGNLANLINAQTNATGISANYNVTSSGFSAIESGRVENLKINDVLIGSFNVEAKDADKSLVNNINKFQLSTGVSAFVDEDGKLNLTSLDGRGMKIEADSGLSSVTNIHSNEPFEVKSQLDNSFISNATISSGFKINGIEINTSDVNISEFIELVNQKYDETGVKVENINSKLNFTSRNTDNMQSASIDLKFASVNDAYKLGLINSESINWRTHNVASESTIDLNMQDGNVFKINGIEIDMNSKTLSEKVAEINSKSSETGVSVEELSDTKVKLTSLNNSEINLYLQDSSNNQDLGLGNDFLNLDFDKLNEYIVKFENSDFSNMSDANLAEILSSYSQLTNTFKYELKTENVYREGFENYGKLTLSTSGSNDIEMSVKGSYLFKNSALNSSSTVVSLKNLQSGFNSNEAEALGLSANTTSKDVINNIIKATSNDFNAMEGNLKTVDDNLQMGISSVKEFVNDLKKQNQEVKNSMEIAQTMHERDALIPTIGNNYVYKAKLDLDTKFMKLLLV